MEKAAEDKFQNIGRPKTELGAKAGAEGTSCRCLASGRSHSSDSHDCREEMQVHRQSLQAPSLRAVQNH